MKQYDLLVIGFGKAGKTLAVKMSQLGKKVALVEKNPQMYGGTCINIGCIPTKTLIRVAEETRDFSEAMSEKEKVTKRLRDKNFVMLNSAEVDLYTATAKFIEDKVVEITAIDGSSERLTASAIVINTGSISRVLSIDGLTTTRNVYDSTEIQMLEELPTTLGIIGGGNIGLEFASLYAKLGSEVTVFEAGKILEREEPSVAKLAKEYMVENGINLVEEAQVVSVNEHSKGVNLKVGEKEYIFSALLYATGRQPAIDGLGLENTNIQLTEQGAVKVDEYCQTNVEGVFAVGDVNGGPQFTYVSLDDFRIVFNYLTKQGSYNLSQRGMIPTTTFIDPPLSRIGMTEVQVKEAGYEYQVNELLVSAMPKAHVDGDLRGIFKVIVDKETKLILGATLFGNASHEVINLIKMAMDHNIPYTYFESQIFTHPTMSENLNDLFTFKK